MNGDELRIHFHPDHWKDLCNSGLSPETIRSLGIHSARPRDIPKLIGWNPPDVQSALVFPYPTEDGFSRVKVFPSLIDDDGHSIKYLQRKNSGVHLYIPPLAQDCLNDPRIPLDWGEGEKKAAKACQEAMPCIGLGGLWGWLTSHEPIEKLDRIAHVNRNERLFPDSDVWAREDLLKAVYAFGRELEGRGAIVQVGILPPAANGQKTGLDDFLQHHNRDDLAQLSYVPLTHKTFRQFAKWFRIWQSKRQSRSGRRHARSRGTPATIELPLSDQRNAELLVQWYGENIRYCHPYKEWLVWDGQRWCWDKTGEMMRIAKSAVKRMAAKVAKLDDAQAQELLAHVKKSLGVERLVGMLKLAQSEPGIPVIPEQLDANPWILNCVNGVVDLKAGTLRAHRRDDLCTKLIPIDFDPTATCPNWESFLLKIMGNPSPDDDGNEEALLYRHERAQRLCRFLQRAHGYSLTGVIAQQVLFFLYGGGANGKSTYSETIAASLGEYYQKAPMDLLMMKRLGNGGPSPELARLCGARLVIAAEISEGHRLNESQIKDLTGKDTLVARGLYKEYIEFPPTHKLWMYGNYKPQIRGTDNAVWRRPKLIPFMVTIPEGEQDPHFLETQLLPELPGILAWAVRGCLDWQQDGLQEPEEVTAATKEYRAEMDVVGRFIDECCVVIKDATVKASAIYASYVKWCETTHEDALKQRTFGAKLMERGYGHYRGTGGPYWWKGIGLFAGSESSDRGERE